MTTRIRRVRTTDPQVSAKVSSFGVPVERADTSRQMTVEDEFQASAISSFFIAPPYSPTRLLEIIERSNMLGPCIDAMVTNVAMCGWDVVPVSDDIPVDANEREILQSFVDSANSEESLTTVNSRIVRENEGVGYGFLEVIRDVTGSVSVLRHAKSSITRLMPRHKDPIKVVYDIQRGPRTSYVTEYRRFRRFVQIVAGKTVYFKEFGDPRRLNCDTGLFHTEGEVPKDMEATELIHFRQDSEDPYGVPRWIAQLPSILGSREAEEVNLRYFEDNTVPPMMLTVSGGRLTATSYRELQKMLQQQGVGKDRQHQIMLVEAVPESSGIDDKGTPIRLDVHKLADTRQSDGLFTAYDESNRSKARSAFRLPPVSVGASQDVNFACYDESTETLTDHGWVTLDGWRDGMRVACYDPETGAIEYHEPDNGLLVYEVADVDMYLIETEQVSQCVTPNHRMLFSSDRDERWGVSPVEEMVQRRRVYFRTSGAFTGGVACPLFEVPDSHYHGGVAARDAGVGSVSSDLILEWIGYYLADGCITQSGNAVQIGARKSRKVLKFEALHESLQDVGFRLRVAQQPAGTYFTVSHKGFAGWLADHAGQGSESKRIPAFVWDLPSEQMRILFDALMECDGTWDGREGRTSGAYSTVSVQLANDVQRLAFLLGYRAALRKDRPGTFGDKPVYRILLSSKETCQVYPDRHVTRETYSGRVYCFSVPTGVFVTRRDGKIAIQGNTANVSAFVAETQVFAPQRKIYDEIYNKRLVHHPRGLNLKTVMLKSKVPAITNPEMLIKTLTALNVMGGVTPRTAIDAANSVLQAAMPQYPERGAEGWEPWMDRPIGLTLRGTTQDTQNEQSIKDQRTKDVEQYGDVGVDVPEHGQE